MVQTTAENDWEALFAQECKRLIEALREIPDGGIVEQIQHIGATSVPGLFGQPCVDMALAVWPFPLDEQAQQMLASLGYELDPDFAGAPEQRFRHISRAFCLYVVEAGSPLWMDYVAVREHLRYDEAARQVLSARKQSWNSATESLEYREVKREWFNKLLADARRSWGEREGFAPLRMVAEELRDYPCQWHFSGGWALDLFLGRVTRVHHDVDVEISRTDQLVLQQYMMARNWKFVTPFEGRLQAWPVHMRLEMPRYQVHAHRSGRFIEFLFANLDGGVWRFRREPTIIRDIGRATFRSDDGIPYIAPELVLLFKSKYTGSKERAKDQVDFQTIYPELEPERRAWLRWALTTCEPGHPWLERL